MDKKYVTQIVDKDGYALTDPMPAFDPRNRDGRDVVGESPVAGRPGARAVIKKKR